MKHHSSTQQSLGIKGGTSKNSLSMLNQRDFADSEEAKPKHTLLYGKALLTVVNGGAKRAIHYKSCRKAEPLLGNKITIQRGIGIFRGSLKSAIAMVALAGLFLWSCEGPAGQTSRTPQSFVILGEAFNVLTGETQGHVFEMQNFVHTDLAVFEEGEVSTPAQQQLWDSAGIRWGFRKKDNPEPIFWVQKNKSFTTKEGEDSYTIEVEDKDKAKFAPQNLPVPLLQESESNLEIYGEINVEGTTVGGTLDLPPDFKSKIQQQRVISGKVLDFAQIRLKKPDKFVPEASIYYIHKETGMVFQTFSDLNGEYSVLVMSYYGNFYRVVLAEGMWPLVEDYELAYGADQSVLNNNDLGLNALPGETTIANDVLYDITEYNDSTQKIPDKAISEGDSIQINTIDNTSEEPKTIPGVLLLFYDKVDKKIYFAKTGQNGSPNVKLPTRSSGTVSGIIFVPAAFGYIPEYRSLVLGQGNIPKTKLRTIGFKSDSGGV